MRITSPTPSVLTDPAPAAVCVVTHNSAGDLPDCLEALAGLDPAPAELVVVDCASLDGSAALARRLAPPGMAVKVVALEENLGFAGGMNRALAESRAPFVLSLNPDARPAPDYLGRLLERASSSHGLQVAAVTGRLLRPPGNGGPRLDACGMRLTLTWRHLDRGSGRKDIGQLQSAERVFGATGAASLFRREALLDAAVDGEVFLSEFHSYREDAELAFRLRERGWEILYEPTAVAVHRRRTVPGTRAQLPAAINLHSLKNRYLVRAYHQTWANLALTAVPVLWRDAAALVYVLARERSSLAAYRWLWSNRRRILARRRQILARRRVRGLPLGRWFVIRSLPL